MNTNCPDKELNGTCTKGEDCPICQPKVPADVQLNVNAKDYVPKKRVPKDKLDFNLKAKEYVPKGEPNEDVDIDEEELEMIDDDINEEEVLEELGNAIPEDDDDDNDEEKWYPKYKDCECCKGFANKCSGKTCESLGVCYCKMKDECDAVDAKDEEDQKEAKENAEENNEKPQEEEAPVITEDTNGK